jgi:hypothetical protein
MSSVSLIKPTPWDTAVFGIPTWELSEYSEKALQQALQIPGHYTIKVEPLADKRLLHEYGFYYCDTLVEPHCNAQRLRAVSHPNATITNVVNADQVMPICQSAFIHGRFHRDFNLSRSDADRRYVNWLYQLIQTNQVYGLLWQDELAGFIGYTGNKLVLHALAEKYRGQGLSKYWWSVVCRELLMVAGNDDLKSSISSTNLAVLNLYASLGFSFNNPLDVYHRMIP